MMFNIQKHISVVLLKKSRIVVSSFLIIAALVVPVLLIAAGTVPTDIMMPGTQPVGVDNPPAMSSVGNCGCHSNVNTDPELDPVYGWDGAMMGNAGRDPLFWATVAVAEQDFIYNPDPSARGGVGDLCIKCHSTGGWLAGRSTPTNASGLDPNNDAEGIMCYFCHLMCDPDQTNNIPSPPEGSYTEEQNAPFFAYDESTGDGYYGGAEYVLNSGDTRMGPYLTNSNHDVIQNPYFRDGRMCGTCHDVSNPAVGDLAVNHGTIAPFTGPFSGIVNGLVDDKAALNNAPHTYGIVERTFTEWIASDIDTLLVNDFTTLPVDLQIAGGALDIAYHRAYDPLSDADYEDGTPRYYTCQTCHMFASVGDGAKQGSQRNDLPQHDQTGGSYWIQQAIQYQDAQGTLVFGSGLTNDQIDAMNDGMVRAQNQLSSAASISGSQISSDVVVHVTNLTGHKLISGYPEGRRMWLNLKWYDSLDALIHEDGEYGPLGNVVLDNSGTPWDVQSLIDPSTTKVYEAKPGMTQEWASQLLALGYPAAMSLEWDNLTNNVTHTLDDLAAELPGTIYHTFHFVLNNAVYSDNRIPPFGYNYDTAYTRNAIPVPSTQFGDPGPGGTYNYWDDVAFPIPPGADYVEVRLYYQSTSWEYIQFLWLENDTLDSFLGSEGINMLDAWLNNSMCPPFEMVLTTVNGLVASSPPPGEATTESPLLLTRNAGNIDFSWGSSAASCDVTDYALYAGDVYSLSSGYIYNETLTCLEPTTAYSIIENDPQITFSNCIYFLVVSSNVTDEGSYGSDSLGISRPPGYDCHASQDTSPCS